MPLPFQYRKSEPRRPWSERLPNGMTVDEAARDYRRPSESEGAALPTIQPYEPETRNAEVEPEPGWGQQPQQKPVQPPPAVDPAILNEAFARPDTTGPQPEEFAPKPEPKPTLADMPAPPVMIEGDKYKRPDEAIGGEDEIDRKQALLRSVRAYQPKNAKGWRRYLGPILQGWAAGQRTSRDGNPWAGVGGAIVGLLTGKFRPKLDDERWQDAKEKEVAGDIDSEFDQQKTQAQVEDLQQRPKIRAREQDRKEARDDAMRDQAEWKRRFEERKQDTYEDFVAWRKANGDRRAETSEGLLQLRREYQEFEKMFKTRQQDNVERHQSVTENQGQQRINQTWKRIDLSQQSGGGKTDAKSFTQFRTKFNQARQAVNKFNELTRRAAQAAAWGDPQSVANEQALLTERDQIEQQIKDQYGDLVATDDKGKPSTLRRMWSVGQFKIANPTADVNAAKAKAAAEGAIIVP